MASLLDPERLARQAAEAEQNTSIFAEIESKLKALPETMAKAETASVFDEIEDKFRPDVTTIRLDGVYTGMPKRNLWQQLLRADAADQGGLGWLDRKMEDARAERQTRVTARENLEPLQAADQAEKLAKEFEARRMDEALESYSSSNLLKKLTAESRGLPSPEAVAEKTAELREPKTLAYNISAQLHKADIRSLRWEKATPDTRQGMLDKAAEVMAKEMAVDPYIRKNLEILHDAKKSACTLCLKQEAGGFVIDRSVAPKLLLDRDLCYQDSLEKALAQTYVQVSSLMEQTVCTEAPGSILDPDLRTGWEKALGKALEKGETYAPAALEKYGKKTDGAFRRIFSSYEQAKTALARKPSFKSTEA